MSLSELTPVQKELYDVLGEIRDCQNLCRSRGGLSSESLVEFHGAHNTYEQVKSGSIALRQKTLVQQMHRLKRRLTEAELNTVLDLSELHHPLH